MRKSLGAVLGLAVVAAGVGAFYGAPRMAAGFQEQTAERALTAGSAPRAYQAFSYEQRQAAADAAADQPVATVTDAHAAIVGESAARMLIRTGTLRLRVDSLGPALAQVDRVAAALGAIVTTSNALTGGTDRHTATVELRVRAESFDRLMDGLRRVGSVENLRVEAQDVGEEYVDVGARLANGRRLEARLLELLATRAGRLRDVIELERELARVREEVDGLEGRRRYLLAHTELSTVNVELAEPAALVGVPGPGVMQQAVERGWQIFVWILAFGVQSLGAVVPLGLAAGAVWAVRRRFAAAA